jgi:hypothetical protein
MKILSTKNIYSIGLVSLVLGLLFNYLFFDKQIGISFVIYAGLLLSGLFGFLKFYDVTYNKSVTWFLLPILFFSLMVGILDNNFLLFWNFAITVGLLLLLAHHIVGRSIKNCLFFDYARTAVMLPLNMIGGAFSALSRMLTIGKGRY